MSDNRKQPDKGMKTPLTYSVAFHIIVILLVIFGLPHFMKKTEIIDAVPIDMVADISEVTTAIKPPVKAPEPEVKKEEPPPKAEPPKPQPPKQAAEPDPEELKSPPKPDKAVEKDDLAPPKKVEEKKPEKKVVPKKVTPPKPKDDKKKDDTEDFDKLLQNLSDDKTPSPETPPDEKNKLMTEPAPSPDVSKFSDVLSISEQDALRQQLQGCWNINPGLKDAQDLAVEVRVVVNPDRTVSSATIVDQGRYNSDTFFRAMADSALRAVQNPRCSPLKLPEEKYNLWHNMTVVFDPKDMF